MDKRIYPLDERESRGPHNRRPLSPLGRLCTFQGATTFVLAVLLAVVLAAMMFRTHLIWTILPVPTLTEPFWNSQGSGLAFQKDGTFQITVFNDLHFGEGEDNPPELGWGPISDQKSLQVMDTILNTESQDLVVLNGDLITGENTYLHNSTQYLDMIVEPLLRRDLLWASSYGNHDQQFNLSTQDLLRREMMFPANSLTRDMLRVPEAGTSNYYLPVFGSRKDRVPALLLWFFDSRGGSVFQKSTENGGRVGIEGVVHNATTRWFLRTQQELKSRYGRAVPSLAFVHIPIYAMAAFQKTGVDKHRQPGLDDDNPLAPQGVWNDEYTGSDIPFMAALLKAEGLMAVFSGHDHGDDWCAKWDRKYPDMSLTGNGLFMCFGRHTGYGGYGTWMRGSRQIRLTESTLGKEFQTWMRLEDRSISGYVVLNSTYGQDQYPAVEKKITHR